jgi:hypothetical protein
MVQPEARKYDDVAIDEVICAENFNKTGAALVIRWSDAKGYFGDFTMFFPFTGSPYIDHESMSKEFCIALMAKLIEKYYKE